MKICRVFLAITSLLVAALLGGCAAKQPATSTAPGDNAGQALALARTQLQGIAPDAEPILIASAGGAATPPLAQWQITLVSRATGRAYSVDTNGGKAKAPVDLGPMQISADALANVIPYDAIRIDSDQAYKRARAELAKTGSVPPDVTQSLALVEIASLPNDKPAVWVVSFSNGTDASGVREVAVDALTGAVTVIQ